MTDKPTTIYALVDPRTAEVRYVGKSVQPERRYIAHMRHYHEHCRHCAAWIRAVQADGLQPEMIVLEVVQMDGDWRERERYWIAYYREMGCDLTNLVEGGGGAGGASAETRALLSARMKEIMSDPDQVARMAAQSRMRWAVPGAKEQQSRVSREHMTPEARAIIGGSTRARFTDPSERAAQSERMKRVSATPEQRAKISAAGKARYEEPGERERTAERAREMWADPDTKAKISASISARFMEPEHRAERSERGRRILGNPENLARLQAGNRAALDDPEKMAARKAAMKAAMTPEARANRSEKMRAFRARQRAEKERLREQVEAEEEAATGNSGDA